MVFLVNLYVLIVTVFWSAVTVIIALVFSLIAALIVFVIVTVNSSYVAALFGFAMFVAIIINTLEQSM